MDIDKIRSVAKGVCARARGWEEAALEERHNQHGEADTSEGSEGGKVGTLRPYLVGIAGVPGAGKSTLATLCAKMIREELGVGATCLPMDGYHFSKAQLDTFPDPAQAHFRRGAAFTFDACKLLGDLEALVHEPGKVHLFPAWSHENGDPSEGAISVDPRQDRIVLVEGNYLLLDSPEVWPRIGALFDETWYVKVDVETAVHRTAVRNAAAFGWTLERTMERVRASDELNMREIIAANPEKKANLVIENPNDDIIPAAAAVAAIVRPAT